ncbi:hypothetical protein HPB48_015317 [Haemaphysalis longicornis]|uniref:Uncharacterized protein n=1 Tax=Haemaphysalis longicornis TaxID=44386 RepID=A0A9J6FRV4_HAELO|nr:hypothetical protein HPB48_015317 [Haemaphysalis longicornis]
MSRVAEEERSLIVELSKKGYCQHLQTVNRIVKHTATKPESGTHFEATLRELPQRMRTGPLSRLLPRIPLLLQGRSGRPFRSVGLRSAVAAQRPLLSASNEESRLRFASSHQSRTVEDWGRGALTAATFCHILDTVEHLQQTGIGQLALVPKGADINIIKNVWGRMKVALNRTPMPSATEDELRAAVLAEWQRLASGTSLVTALNESLPSRMSAVVEVNGDMTH